MMPLLPLICGEGERGRERERELMVKGEFNDRQMMGKGREKMERRVGGFSLFSGKDGTE